MAERISLRARKPFTHGGREMRPGMYFHATPVEAAVLHYQRVAEFAEPPADPDESDTPRAKRRYRRRDLQPES